MNFVNKTTEKVGKNFFERIAKKTFGYLNEKSDYEFDLVLVSEKEIKALNKKYRKLDKITDVLTFELKNEKFLGQIFICPNQVFRDSFKTKKSKRLELAEVFIHGILHLFGYNDETKKGYQKMIFLQKKILKKIK